MTRRRKRDRVNRERVDLSSRLALRADGAILLNIKDLRDRDLSGYEVQSYVTLGRKARAIVRRALSDCDAGTAAILPNLFPKSSTGIS